MLVFNQALLEANNIEVSYELNSTAAEEITNLLQDLDSVVCGAVVLAEIADGMKDDGEEGIRKKSLSCLTPDAIASLVVEYCMKNLNEESWHAHIYAEIFRYAYRQECVRMAGLETVDDKLWNTCRVVVKLLNGLFRHVTVKPDTAIFAKTGLATDLLLFGEHEVDHDRFEENFHKATFLALLQWKIFQEIIVNAQVKDPTFHSSVPAVPFICCHANLIEIYVFYVVEQMVSDQRFQFRVCKLESIDISSGQGVVKAMKAIQKLVQHLATTIFHLLKSAATKAPPKNFVKFRVVMQKETGKLGQPDENQSSGRCGQTQIQRAAQELCKNLGLHLRRNASSELDCVIAEDDLSSDDEPTSPPSGCFLCYRDRNSVYLKFGPYSQKRVTHEKQMLKMASVSGCEVPRDVMSGETVIQEESISYLVL